MEPTLFIDAYKAGGFALLLVMILVVVIYGIHRANLAREERMAKALDVCQQSHASTAASTATLIANNTNAMNALCEVMRDRPCLKEPTPAKAHAHIPDIRPPQHPL